MAAADIGVAVVGAGIAGRMAAIAAARFTDVVLLTDAALNRCNSVMAQGGIHAPVDPPSGHDAMVDDILRSARVPVDRERVAAFVRGAGEITGLMQQWGLVLDREPDGSLRRRMAGGMSQARVLTAGDEIGVPVLRVLEDQLRGAGVALRPHTPVVDVAPAAGGVRIETESGDRLRCASVVLATGGTAYARARSSHRPTTNPRNDNHRLYELLLQRGVPVRDEQFWQLQPFGLVDGPAGPPGRCVPESVASLGPRLLDRFGRPVADPGADRLALTEAMAAASDRTVAGSSGSGFLLTLSELDVGVLRDSYPKLLRTLRHMGAARDGEVDDVVVAPFLHYQLGGIQIDPHGATAVPGVFAAGEMTGGLHGRNRLMGAGITDALVTGRSAGEAAGRLAAGR